jgi:Na+-translocating ferredoxin:NAD+ oxidoreductase RnfD subunit
MYQLFSFFMVTDPRTTVRSRNGRILVVILVAVMEALIRLGNDFHLGLVQPFAPAPAMFALAIVGPTAMFIDQVRQPPIARRPQSA